MKVKNKRERSLQVTPPGVEQTSTLDSRDPIASEVKCGPHGGKNSKMKSCAVPWLSLKAKIELGLCGGQVMSGDWRRPHQVRGVSSGSQENDRVPWLIHKAKAEDRRQQHQASQTGGSDQSDRCATTLSRDFEAEGMHQNCKACIRATQGAIAGHPSDGATTKIPKVPLGGVYLSFRP
jgi:hypothetical protein